MDLHISSISRLPDWDLPPIGYNFARRNYHEWDTYSNIYGERQAAHERKHSTPTPAALSTQDKLLSSTVPQSEYSLVLSVSYLAGPWDKAVWAAGWRWYCIKQFYEYWVYLQASVFQLGVILPSMEHLVKSGDTCEHHDWEDETGIWKVPSLLIWKRDARVAAQHPVTPRTVLWTKELPGSEGQWCHNWETLLETVEVKILALKSVDLNRSLSFLIWKWG